MRSILAALFDALAVAVLGFLAFRLAVAAAPCRSLGECSILTPMAIAFVLIVLALYFGLSYLLWRTTPGQAVFRPAGGRSDTL